MLQSVMKPSLLYYSTPEPISTCDPIFPFTLFALKVEDKRLGRMGFHEGIEGAARIREAARFEEGHSVIL